MRRLSGSINAFTIVELLMVMGIVGVLALMSIPTFNQYMISVKNNRCIADIRTIDKAVTAYIIDKNALPATLADAGIGNQTDPWLKAFVYQPLDGGAGTPITDSIEQDLNTDYDLYSKGPNDMSDPNSTNPVTDDDIVRSNNGQYVGKRSELL